MNRWADLAALNVAWVTFEVAKYTELIQGALSVAGAITLLAINVLRLRKLWNEHSRVDKP